MCAVPGESRRRLRPLLIGLGIAGVAGAYWGLDLPHRASVTGMRALVDAYAPFGPLILMAMIVAGIFTQVPFMGTLMIAIGGVLFPGFPAFAYGWGASIVGTTATFVLARSVARDYVQRSLDDRSTRLRALDDRLTRHGFLTVLVLRVFGALAPPLNWGLALTGVRFRDYVAGTALGLVPGIATIVLFSDAIASRGPGEGGVSLVALLRGLSLLAFGVSALKRGGGGAAAAATVTPAAPAALDSPAPTASEAPAGQMALLANLASFAILFPLLFVGATPTDGGSARLWAIAGSVLALAGARLVRRSREALGPAWSLVARADPGAEVVMTGPYRLVRHPVYLGLSMIALGAAVAFGSVPALLVAALAVVPTFAWRGVVEERLLGEVFGERYRAYRSRTRFLIPYVV